MAVYEHTYRQYAGEVTREWSRFLIIPRHAYRDVFGSKLFIAFFALCFIYPLVAAILIYLHHNVTALGALRLPVTELVPINASFFKFFVVGQCMIGFFLTILVGPPQVARDLTNNALPLYLCRPFSRAEYVVGKMSVVIILLSLITWVPGLLLFLFQGYLEGGGWLRSNLWVASAILLGSWIWIIVLALVSQAVSAWVKWRMAASAALLGLFFIPSIFAEVINNLFNTQWGNLISLRAIMQTVWAGLFADIYSLELPLWAAWMMLLVVSVISLMLLARKVRAYEVVS